MDLTLIEPEMSPRAARRLATRLRRECDREKREWKEEVVGIGSDDVSGGVVRRMLIRRRRSNGGDFGVPMDMGFA